MKRRHKGRKSWNGSKGPGWEYWSRRASHNYQMDSIEVRLSTEAAIIRDKCGLGTVFTSPEALLRQCAKHDVPEHLRAVPDDKATNAARAICVQILDHQSTATMEMLEETAREQGIAAIIRDKCGLEQAERDAAAIRWMKAHPCDCPCCNTIASIAAGRASRD